MKKVDLPLVGFVWRTTYTFGMIDFSVVLGKGQKSIKINVFFIIVDNPST